MWTLLLVTLPTQPNAVRLRIWRALKALGCAALRDGAYLLPAAHGIQFEPLATEVHEHGGTALLLDLGPRDDAQRDELLALFDRSEAYAQWHGGVTALLGELPALAETEARRRLRAVVDALHCDRCGDGVAQGALRPLNGHLRTVDGHLDPGRDRDGKSSDS